MTEADPPPERYPGKFSSPRDELLYEISMHGWNDAEGGESDSPTGWFARFSITTDDLNELIAALDDTYARMGREHFKTIVGHHILFEDDRGFVTVRSYKTEEELLHDFGLLEEGYAFWLEAQERAAQEGGDEPI